MTLTRAGTRKFHFRYKGQRSVLYAPFRASLETGVQSSRKGPASRKADHSPTGTTPWHFGLFPPFGRASINRRQILRFGSHSSGTALHFLHSSIPGSAHTDPTGYSHRVSPVLFPNAGISDNFQLSKADASQNGFHPAYALSCRMAWRNSLNILFSRSTGFRPSREGIRRFPLDGCIIARRGSGIQRKKTADLHGYTVPKGPDFLRGLYGKGTPDISLYAYMLPLSLMTKTVALKNRGF